MNKFYCLLFLFSYCFASNYYRYPEEAHEVIRKGFVDLRDGRVAKMSERWSSYQEMIRATIDVFGGKLNLITKHTEKRRKKITAKNEEIDQIQRQHVKSSEDLQENLRIIKEAKGAIEKLEGQICESQYRILKSEYERLFPPCPEVKITEALQTEYYKEEGKMSEQLWLRNHIRIAPIDEGQVKEVDQLYPALSYVSFDDYGHPDMAQDKSFEVYSENGISCWRLSHRNEYYLELRMIGRLSVAAAAAAVSSSKQEPQSPEKQKLPKTKKAECLLL